MIETVERFTCSHCGFRTEANRTIKLIRKTENCPACQNDKLKGEIKWSS